MKLLLTSAGITNASIAKALFGLVGKKPEDTSLVFVPTASNVETGDKDWLIKDLKNLDALGLKEIMIADISAVGKEIWLEQFKKADVLFFEGGNTYHLMEWINKSGLADTVTSLLKTKVWVGVSAGSMVTSPDLLLKISQIVYGGNLDGKADIPGLKLVNFCVLPHLNAEYFTQVREKTIRQALGNTKYKVYALDDMSALKIHDSKVEVISEGEWFMIN